MKFPAQMIVKAEVTQQGHCLLGPYTIQSMSDTKSILAKLSEQYNEGKLLQFYLINSDNTWII